MTSDERGRERRNREEIDWVRTLAAVFMSYGEEFLRRCSVVRISDKGGEGIGRTILRYENGKEIDVEGTVAAGCMFLAPNFYGTKRRGERAGKGKTIEPVVYG